MSEYFGLRIPFAAYCGIRGVDHGPGWTLSEVDLHEHMYNSKGTGHGGLIMTLLDTSMGSTARLSDPDSSGVLTVDLHTSFIGPAHGSLQCKALVVHRAGNTVFCEATVQCSDGNLVARGMGTFKLRHQKHPGASEG